MSKHQPKCLINNIAGFSIRISKTLRAGLVKKVSHIYTIKKLVRKKKRKNKKHCKHTQRRILATKKYIELIKKDPFVAAAARPNVMVLNT